MYFKACNYRSCYATQAGIATCSSTVLTGKRRKREEELMVPEAIVNGETVDVRDLIKASRVSRDNKKEQSHVLTVPQIFEASIEDVPQCLVSGRNGEEDHRQPRLITVTTTVTSFTYATMTVTPATTQTFSFLSGAAGANAAQTCFPSALMSSAGISGCR